MNRMASMIQVSDLSPGQGGIIVRIDDAQDATTLRRLGFQEGVVVTVLNPGKPALVQVGNARVAVDPQMLSRIEVCTL